MNGRTGIAPVGESPGPREDGRDAVGARLATLLVHAEVARHSAVRGLRLDRLAVRAHLHSSVCISDTAVLICFRKAYSNFGVFVDARHSAVGALRPDGLSVGADLRTARKHQFCFWFFLSEDRYTFVGNRNSVRRRNDGEVARHHAVRGLRLDGLAVGADLHSSE